ncbi:helicase associated domain-containing protein [Embleya sp. NPDC020886]|uniref:helicase associated domain-containing protein n=1 Tax=Embleya sp. NPDC020886 TaxID=3363980 RepID=UPI003791690E
MRNLVMLGMVWSHPDAAFDDGLATARRYVGRVGHLAAPQNAVQDGVRIGQWLANQRRAGVLDAHPERRRALEELDPWWRPDGWTIAWQRAANEVRLHLARGGALEELTPGHVAGGRDIGRWAQWHRRAAVRARLRPGQLEQLDALGIRPECDGGAAEGDGGGAARGGGGAAGGGVENGAVAAGDGVGGPVADRDGARAPRRGRGAWETAFAAAVAYREREGDLDVPRAHVETVAVETAAGSEGGEGEGGGVVEVRLGKWVNNQRNRRSSLAEERVRLLTELGMRW